jgi:hypothetical protein
MTGEVLAASDDPRVRSHESMIFTRADV